MSLGRPALQSPAPTLQQRRQVEYRRLCEQR